MNNIIYPEKLLEDCNDVSVDNHLQINNVIIGQNNKIIYHKKIVHSKSNTSSIVQNFLIVGENSEIDYKVSVEVLDGVTNCHSKQTVHVLKIHPKSYCKISPFIKSVGKENKIDHGMVVYNLNTKDIFYLMSKGYSCESAVSELVYAKINNFVPNIENIKEKININLKYLIDFYSKNEFLK